jgi:predicted CoA-binding protein
MINCLDIVEKFKEKNMNGAYSQVDDQQIREILKNAKTIAVVGLSSNPERPSHGVTRYMQGHGYKIYPVNPGETEVLGEKASPDLTGLPVIPDIVNVFRRSETVLPIVDECIAKGVKCIWFQLGVINYEAIEKASKNNIKTIVDKCILIEHRRLGI